MESEKLKFIIRVKNFIKHITNLHDDTNIEATVNSITKDIVFKGANLWILFFAVIVASIGLNVNSTAVVIGAMLISPLMGPINGIGLAIGTDDNVLLRNSLRNFATMVLVSLVASTTYFLVSPLSDAQSELLARTKPTIFDVLIAFFGGMAGIIAASRKEGKITIISGVAIATALMPPLSTAGFGLATGQLDYFIGAFYLFFINSFFIALATFLMVRFMHFPVREIVDPEKRKVQRRSISIFALIVIVPSIYIAWNVIDETRFNSQAIKYVTAIQKEEMFEQVEIINAKREYSKKDKLIQISLVGNSLSEKQINRLEKRLIEFGLADTKLRVRQTSGTLDLGAQAGVISKLLEARDRQLFARDSTITQLQLLISQRKVDKGEISLLAKELAVQYPKIKTFSLTNSILFQPATNKADTVTLFYVEWSGRENPERIAQLKEWLKVKTNSKKVKIVEMK